tara:strand:- start:119 stop:412 length:294 start_codon:yes stop_codon:yes gene_type:complete
MGLITVGSTVWACSIVVEQRNRSFLQKEISIKIGDKVIFVNSDDYGHNVYSETDGSSFDIGLQEPGERLSVVFDTPGTVEVKCRIHPRMQLTVEVVE